MFLAQHRSPLRVSARAIIEPSAVRLLLAGNNASTGGGLCITGSGATVALRRSRLLNNTASGAESSTLTVDCATAGSGGGACIAASASVELSNSVLMGNTATFGGGALVALCDDVDVCGLDMNGMAFAENVALAGGAGAGLYLAARAPAQQLSCAAPAGRIGVVELATASANAATAARARAAADAASGGSAGTAAPGDLLPAGKAASGAATTTTFVANAGKPVVVDGEAFQPIVTLDPPVSTAAGGKGKQGAATTTTFVPGAGSFAAPGCVRESWVPSAPGLHHPHPGIFAGDRRSCCTGAQSSQGTVRDCDRPCSPSRAVQGQGA